MEIMNYKFSKLEIDLGKQREATNEVKEIQWGGEKSRARFFHLRSE